MKSLNPVTVILLLILGIPVGMAGFAAFSTPVEQPAPIVIIAEPIVAIPAVPTPAEIVRATVTMRCVGEGNEEWSGSGTFIDGNGTILTAAHVLQGAVVIMAVLNDGTMYPAVDPYFLPDVDVGFCKLIGPAPESFLKIAATSPKLGDTIRVVGSPWGLTFYGTIFQGIVSCEMRMLDDREYLQIDAAAIPGNSGGPVVNQDGEIIGVLVSGVQVGVEINFAVPVKQVQAMLICYEANKNLKAVLWHPKPQNLN